MYKLKNQMINTQCFPPLIVSFICLCLGYHGAANMGPNPKGNLKEN